MQMLITHDLELCSNEISFHSREEGGHAGPGQFNWNGLKSKNNFYGSVGWLKYVAEEFEIGCYLKTGEGIKTSNNSPYCPVFLDHNWRIPISLKTLIKGIL